MSLGISLPFLFIFIFSFEVLIQRHLAQTIFKKISVASNVCILASGLIAHLFQRLCAVYFEFVENKSQFPPHHGIQVDWNFIAC